MTTRTIARFLRSTVLIAAAMVVSGVVGEIALAADAEMQEARKILDAAGVEGGLVVHLGCGDGRLTAALHATDAYLVQGLDSEAANVDRARRHIKSLGVYGQVTTDRLTGGKLPYADNVVNLVVAEKANLVSKSEIMRVLCPEGVVCVKKAGSWTKTLKPRPAELDEWTHFLYDATNNAVSHDTAVDQPYHIQWIGDPKWARSHDHLASISAVVSTAGRIFYIADEGPTAAVALPAKWMLVARDAFNGVVLWKRQLGVWEGHLRGFRTGPPELARRLVAVGDRVFVTPGYGEPLCCLDAATGRTVKTYQGTEDTLEVLHADGLLFLVTGRIDVAEAARRRGESPAPGSKSLMVVDADSGKTLWRKSDAKTDQLLPQTLAASEKSVFFQNPEAVVCLDRQTGQENWQSARPVRRDRWSWSTPTLVVHQGVVISADRAAESEEPGATVPERVEWEVSSSGGEAPPGEMIAFSADDGRELWRSDAQEAYNSPPDVLVTGDRLWSGNLVRARDPGITEVRNVLTGKVEMERPSDQDYFTFGMGHHRCYRNKATDRFLLLGRSGVEFLDVATGDVVAHHYVRGACQYGIMAANGLLYAPSHSCACFIEAKLNGFNALAPRRREGETGGEGDRESKTLRLQRGPAYGKLIPNPESLNPSPSDWPTYRRDTARSGFSPRPVSTELKTAWQTKLGGKLTSPVKAEGRVFVAAVDTHTVHALNAADGRQVWDYTAGGRIDSPPTIHRGTVLFGSADGYVYCLRAADGELLWRFMAADEDRKIVVYGQLESAWPVPGSVLVVEEPVSPGGGVIPNAVAYVTAGRTSYLDGGISLWRLDATTGQALSRTVLDNRDPETGLPPQREAKGVGMPGALPDVLSFDGQSIYMRHTRFDRQGEQQAPDVAHLFSPAGFVDDSWWHRTYWLFGTEMMSGWGGWEKSGYQTPAGRLLVVDDLSVYGFGRLNQYATHGAHVGVPKPLLPWPLADQDDRARGVTEYQLFACPREPELIKVPRTAADAQAAQAAATAQKSGRKPKLIDNVVTNWAHNLDIVARAMVMADQTIFVAGPPELLAIEDVTSADPDLAVAQAGYEGHRGAKLLAVSKQDGRKLAEYELDSPPVFDGLIAAGGRLYLSLHDGSVRCMGSSTKQ